VLVSGLPALALSGFILLLAGLASALACFDTCMPAAQARASDIGFADFGAFLVIAVLLPTGLAVPALRRAVTITFSASIVFAIGWVVLR
jgi:hypothetical protein